MAVSDKQSSSPLLRMRGKLVLIFILIKVLPLILLAWLAWTQSTKLVDILGQYYEMLSESSSAALSETGALAINDSVNALDERARNEIERITTDTAKNIAQFLYARDDDIQLLASLTPSHSIYTDFLQHRNTLQYEQEEWRLAEDSSRWEPLKNPETGISVVSTLQENDKAFHSRATEVNKPLRSQPLYLEATFIAPTGMELYKVTTSKLMSAELKDISKAENTFVNSEDYFHHLVNLSDGEIYVSDVIGAYVPSRVIGSYTPASARKAGIEFEPEKSAYAGKENPVGRKFQGLVRWATPVMKNGKLLGYVTLALDHSNIMAFTDSISPTEKRYSAIADASDGNYAFMWDYKGRNIAHPRHYFIAGYDAQTGAPAVPWLEQSIYDDWQAGGLPYAQFVEQADQFRDQNLSHKPASELGPTGMRALDCRFLNFAPQCKGWFDLTSEGGSGSFVIFWSNLWKLTTAAPIPYYTGLYADSKRGFGFVTIGANVDDFHEPAVMSKQKIDQRIAQNEAQIVNQTINWKRAVTANLHDTASSLFWSTLFMITLVIIIAVWMASYFTGRILQLIQGISSFKQEGEFRFASEKQDEMGELAAALDGMADQVDQNLYLLKSEIQQRKKTEQELRESQETLEDKVEERTRELTFQIKQREMAELKVRYLADHDALTGLPNRRDFTEKLALSLARADASQKQVALLFIDLDRFKEVNDTLGHAIGDLLLCYIAKLLKESVREDDLVARLGGDEFAIVMTNIDSHESVSITSRRIIEVLSKPVSIDGNAIDTGLSVGITIYPENKVSPEQLMLQADLALYEAKSQGGLCYQYFHPSMQVLHIEKTQFGNALSRAFEQNEFCLYYQPQFDYGKQAVVGVESLIRWQHPEQGVIEPDKFFAVAQRAALFPQLDQWVVNEVCRQAVHWLEDGLEFGKIAFNVCAVELQKKSFPKVIISALESTGLDPKFIEVELTESSLIEHFDVVLANIKQLRELGISIVIHDLGAEYSSLKQFIKCPVDIIKIDRCFVKNIGDKKSEAIICALLDLSNRINLEVIANGVETEIQLAYLQEAGCHVIQGFLHAKPMPEHEFRQYLAKYRS
ncbi:putative bifunctional diguanylate cyclase/phosphodiesterase [Psychromonas ossibalaenae]|uniref:putative bifunctional diguanylate cyclase/phosphodiesterase n=1 Tax=Psychromonas ossibalaenae TaxID=444922 RepID=UPI0003750559|nr:EAL domain-containing protein [Psychromonas ossibalaenae]